MDFYKRMQYVCARIPYGRVASYGQIALLCGKPRNARQVGYALCHGKAGEVPAYRIVNSQGVLSGAASFEYPDLQKLLLEEEGVEVRREPKGWRVDMQKYGWRPTLEEAEELRRIYGEQQI